MGLGDLIGATDHEVYIEGKTGLAYEEAADGVLVHGKRSYRAAVRRAGHYVKIEYSEPVCAKSYLYDYENKLVGYGSVEGKNFFLIPYIIDEILYEQYNDLRTTLLRDCVTKRTGVPLVSTDFSGVYAYLYGRNEDQALILVNTTVDCFERVRFRVFNFSVNEILMVDRKTGALRRVEFTQKNGEIFINEPFAYLSTHTLLLK